MRKLLIAVVVIGMLALGVSAAGAQGERAPRRPGVDITREVINAIAEAVGLKPVELVQQLRDGASLNEVITAQGGDVAAVQAEVTNILTERVNEAVANGKLTQERADQLIERLGTAVERVFSGEVRDGLTERSAQVAVLQMAAEQTGLTRAELMAELRAGNSLADVLTANGVDVNAFIDEAVTKLDTQLDKLVENGRLAQERADELLANFRERLTERINQVGPAENTEA
ncbi:MAG: hypothetical protein HXY41_04920 [Chloroflexi bacterium]|nr:hypothetical protein [Chloroflexota bacterium]